MSAACVLFFLGFIAPWCWLIGGWCLSTQTGHLKESEGQFVDTVDRRRLWWPKRKTSSRVGPRAGKKSRWSLFSAWNARSSAARARSDRLGQSTAHGDEMVPMTPIDTSIDSRASINPVYSLHLSSGSKEEGKEVAATTTRYEVVEVGVVDRWVRKCRIAAFVSGALLCVAMIIASIAIAGVTSK